jgi:uncharacterized protein YbjT (DUF2867 family)
MRVLLTGASGFLGRHLAAQLQDRGHEVVCAGRLIPDRGTHVAPVSCNVSIPADFSRDTDPGVWLPRLRDIDAVINAVGIFREHGTQTFDGVHVRSPVALFDACVVARVNRVIQVSALGADAGAKSRYHLSKHRADRHLASLPIDWTIVQPSLIYGADGRSSRLLASLASLPFTPVPGHGDQWIQPVHIDDVTAAIASMLESVEAHRKVIPLVGPEPLRLRDYLVELRRGMGLGKARIFFVPLALMRVAAHLGPALPGSLLDKESLSMLLRGNTADAAPLRALLHREARPPSRFVAPTESAGLRLIAQLHWLLPLLRISIASVWIFTGIVSLGLFPTESSYLLLERVGVPRSVAPLFLYSAAALDLALGIATICMRRRKALWLVQIGLILGYTIVITMHMPEFWLHPYGPLLKNLPMLAAIALLYRLEER